VIGMPHFSGAKYGLMTGHFLWVGARPAMVVLAIFPDAVSYWFESRSCPNLSKCVSLKKARG